MATPIPPGLQSPAAWAQLVAPWASAPAPPPPPVSTGATVKWFGGAGTFGPLAGLPETASGNGIACVPVTGWQFGAGLAAFYTCPAPDGQIVLSTLPLTGNELLPTMDHAEINVFDPVRMIFTRNVIPTSLGALTATGSNGLGGTDAGSGDLRPVVVSGTNKIMFTCAGYYFGWNISTAGLYPAIGYLTLSASGIWMYDQADSLTGDQLHATNPTLYGAVIAPNGQVTGTGGTYWPTDAVNQMAVLPSGNIVIGHYFAPPGTTSTSGLISVVSPAGALLASFQVPNMTIAGVTITLMAVRDVEADPSSSAPDERFCVIYDSFTSPSVQSCFQEFSYNSATQTIAPVTLPTTSSENGVSSAFAYYDTSGSLYVACGSGLSARNLAVFVKTAGVRSNVAQASVVAGWQTNHWATPVRPDYSLGFPVSQGLSGLAGPMIEDTSSSAILLTGDSGRIGAAVPDPTMAGLGPNLISPGDSVFTQSQLLSADDQTFATSTGTWAPFLGSIARVVPPHAPPSGTEALQLEEAFGSAIFFVQYAITPGAALKWSTNFLAQTTARTCEVYLQYLDITATSTVGLTSHITVTDNTATWTPDTVSGTAPNDAYFVQAYVVVDSSGAGENHYIAANSLLQTSPLNWHGFVTGVGLSTAVMSGGNPVLAIQGIANNYTMVATGPVIPVTAGREYLASAEFQCASGSVPGACALGFDWLDANGKTISQTSTGSESITDAVGSWTAPVRVGAYAPPGAVSAQVVLKPFCTTTGNIHYATNITLQAQPYTAPPFVDTGLQVLKNTGLNMGTGRSSIVSGILYVPVQNIFTAAQLSAYNANPSAYTPAFQPQWLVAVSLFNLYNGEPFIPPPPIPPPHYVIPPSPPRQPWRFLYGPRAPTGGFAGAIVQASQRLVTLRAEPDQNSQVIVEVDGRGPEAAAVRELETDFTVMYGGQFVFTGRVAPSQDTVDAAAHRTVFTASDYRDVLRRQLLLPGDTLSYTNVEQQQIAWGLIQSAQHHDGGNLGITQGLGAAGSGVQRTMTFAAGDYAGDDISSMGDLANGFEWLISPYGAADLRFDFIYPQMGSQTGRVLAYGMQRVQSIQRVVDPGAYADAVYVTGDPSVTLTAQSLEAAGITSSPQGRWDQAIGSTMKTQSSLNDFAAQALTAAQVLTPSYTVVLQPGTWEGPDDIWLGDTVELRIKSGRLVIDEQIRVVEMSFAIDANGLEILALTLGQIPLQIHKLISKILKNLALLNTR